MSEPPLISPFVKLDFWDVYRLNIVLIATIFRKILYIWGLFALLWLGLSILLFFHPAHGPDPTVMMQNMKPLKWALALPILFLFVLPLLSAQRISESALIKQGVSYQFSEAGIHIETSLSKSDLSWAAIHKVRELSSEFLVFTGPRLAYTLPKRCFVSSQGVTALRELFRTHVQKTNLRRD